MCTVFKAGIVFLMMLCVSDAKAQLADTVWHTPQDTTKSTLLLMPMPSELSTPVIQLPVYTQGAFCDFEDALNRKRKLRIDFSVR